MFPKQRILFLLENKNFSQMFRNLSLTTPAAIKQSTARTTTQDDITLSTEWSKAKTYDKIPSMSLLRIVGNSLPGGKFAKLDLAQMFMAMKDELGPILRLKGVLGQPNSVLTHNPDDFEKVLRNEGQWPARPGSEGLCYHRAVHRADFFEGVDGLIGTQGQQWSSFRTVVNPVLLQPRNVKFYLQKMSQVNKEFIQRIYEIRNPQTLEVPPSFEEELNRWTLESISIVALDKQLGILSNNRDNPKITALFNLILDVFKYSVDVEFKPPIWKYYKTKAFRKLMKALDDVTDITSKFVDEAIKRIEEQQRNGVPEKAENEQSVLEKLIKIDRKIAKVMAMDLLMTGVDTTSSAFTGVLLCLAKNPEKQQKLREEILKVLPHKDSEFDSQAFANLPFLRACIKEALRFYPLGIGSARVSAHDAVLSGYQVPKGTQILMINLSLLENEAHYTKAKEYLPERWLRTTNEAAKGNNFECLSARNTANPFINIPFGFGARSCVGRRIAEMEMEVGIARLVRNFHIEYNYPTENAFKTLLIRVPNIPLTFKFSDVKD